MNISNLNEKAEKYTLSKETLDKRENDRLSFIEKFPLDKLSILQIDQFVQGTDENSFCYWLEFKKIGFGIGGGNASKFGLYKTNNNGEPVYAISYGKNKRFLDYDSAQKFYSELLSKIQKSLDYTKNDEIEKIKDLDIPMWNMVLLKILSIYYPEKFLNIGSPTVLIKCATEIGLKGIDLTSENSIQINYKCKKAIINNPSFTDWPDEKIGSFIWETFDDEEEKNKKSTTQRYFLVGAFWDGSTPSDQTLRFLENGIWENGYDDKFLEEVKSLPVGSKIAIKAVFTREKSISVMAIKARGIVRKNYNDGKKLGVDWEKDFLPFEVEFTGGYWATIKEVTEDSHIDQIFNLTSLSNNPNIFEISKNKFEAAVFENYMLFLKRIVNELGIKPNDNRVVYSVRNNRLNLIVGQRYCFNLFLNESKGSFGVISKDKLNESSLSFEGHHPQHFYTYFKEFIPSLTDWKLIIEAITNELNRATRSSYSRYNNSDFENYVFGLFPEKKSNNDNMNFPLNLILYGPPGTGKTYYTVLKAAEIIENRKIDSYDEALKIFKANLHNQIEFITFHQNYSYEDFIQGLRPDTKDETDQLKFKKSDGVFKIIADKALSNYKESEKAPEEISQVIAFSEALETLKDKILESEEPIKINETAYFTAVEDDAFRYSGDNWTLNDKGFNGFRMKYSDLVRFFDEDVKERKEIKKLDKISGLAKQHATYFIKVFELVKSLMPKTSKKVELTKRKNYVIIIDEINRANISRVFGELITLIEPDKRSHGTIPLEAKLPSGDTFVVPSNLYIIGTMNTADKSIALLDIALRRRFEFEAMYPKYEIKNQEIYDVEILKKINERIVKTKGHDFQIGHAYFMGDNNDLVTRMNNKVIPLLLEYYMNDDKEVKDMLQSAGLVIEEFSWPLRIKGRND
jgi:5-methylcytosine-specific restriction endonuclease McrBC GTP-binding regulatory subunit McrB